MLDTKRISYWYNPIEHRVEPIVEVDDERGADQCGPRVRVTKDPRPARRPLLDLEPGLVVAVLLVMMAWGMIGAVLVAWAVR